MNFRHVNPTLASFCMAGASEEHLGHDCSQHEHHDSGKVNRLPIRFFPDEILNKVCAPVFEVNDAVRQLAKDMLLTMMVEGGIGLAAPQVGKLIRVFVADVNWVTGTNNSDPHIFINPEIEPVEDLDGFGRHTSEEGCLSFPGASGKVERYRAVKVSFLDMNGYRQVMEARGRLGVVVQHEMDHLDGKTIHKAIPSFEMAKAMKHIKAALRERRRESKTKKR